MDELKKIIKEALIVIEKDWEKPIHIGYDQWLALINDEKFKR